MSSWLWLHTQGVCRTHTFDAWLSPALAFVFEWKRMTSLSLQQINKTIFFYLGQKPVDSTICYCENFMPFYHIHRTCIQPHTDIKLATKSSVIVVGCRFQCTCAMVWHIFFIQLKVTHFFSTFVSGCWFLISIISTPKIRSKLLCFLSFITFSKANALLISILLFTFLFLSAHWKWTS